MSRAAGDAALVPAAAQARPSNSDGQPQPATDADGTRLPWATYRLQLNGSFTFAAATAIVDYLAELGVSDVYCSPYLRARPGSTHGYDIVDHNAINPEIGTRQEFERFCAALAARGMGQILDIVPNHMGVLGGDNAWWLDVLEHGRASRHASYFDIDWQPANPDLANRVLVPVLGDHYGLVLERGELALAFDAERGGFEVRYFEHHFPIDPREYPRILDLARALAGASLAEAEAHELAGVSAALRRLPHRSVSSTRRRLERAERAQALRGRLAALVAGQPQVAVAIAQAVSAINGTPGVAESYDALDRLLEAQAYRLAYWRVASDDINYRRFFNVHELGALRVEHEPVFQATHALVFELLKSGAVTGLRIDHPDGLNDPAAYFRRLQKAYAAVRAGSGHDPRRPQSERPLYLVIEKIIASFERIPESWTVHGTTGYRFSNLVNGLFVDNQAERRMTRIYVAFIGERSDFEQIARRCKRIILGAELAAELTVLANQLARISRADRRTRDYTFNALRAALAEVIAFFPVYRSYIAREVSAEDKRYIDWAVARARRHSRAADVSVFDFVRAVLLRELPAGRPRGLGTLARAFAMRFQQLTAPVMAKGVEDTAFYVYNRLLSLNDVGGDPATFGIGVRAFHGASADRAKSWPHTLIATSTHDSKRSEDVRARIDALSEMPAAWRLWLRRWSRMNRSRKQSVNDEPAPCANDEYLLYQTLLGTLPVVAPLDEQALTAYRERIAAYMLKAVREAKVHTSWVNNDANYEAAVTRFVHALLAAEGSPFMESLRQALAPIAWIGLLNSLAMLLIKLTSPGIPDIYQGNELLDFSLVDPDNRRPVDFALRSRLLRELGSALDARDADRSARVRALFDAAHDGRAKLLLTARGLALRRERAQLFASGGYTPLEAKGTRADHVVAYARRHAGAGVIAIVGRLYARLIEAPGQLPCGERVWQDTSVELPQLAEGAQLHEVLTGRRLVVTQGGLRLADALADFPGAILVYDAGERAA